MNAYSEDLRFEVPKAGRGWLQVVNTAEADAAPAEPQPSSGPGQAQVLKSRSLVLLVEQSCF